MVDRRQFLVLTASSLLASCGKKSAGNELRIGMDLTNPPFEMQDKSGNPDGVGVKMAEALVAHLGRPLKIVPLEFSGLI
ncbi:MAG: transporter substrate-binding domain-containing protein, partial [Verrucomicrobiaceae bacterium]